MFFELKRSNSNFGFLKGHPFIYAGFLVILSSCALPAQTPPFQQSTQFDARLLRNNPNAEFQYFAAGAASYKATQDSAMPAARVAFQKGVDAFNGGHYQVADSSFIEAQNHYLCTSRDESSPDFVEAKRLCGLTYYYIGELFLKGLGRPQSDRAARNYFQIGVDNENPESMIELATLYHHGGTGIDRDLAKAESLLAKAKEAGSEDATTQLTQVRREIQSIKNDEDAQAAAAEAHQQRLREIDARCHSPIPPPSCKF